LVTEQSDQIQQIKVCFYLRSDEFEEFKKQAIFMFEQKVIPRPTVGTFAKAAGYKWFNEITQKAMKERGLRA
jgi:hypothetical protein